MQLLRVQNFTVSADGYGAGAGQTLERPFGHADPGQLFAWAGATASWPNRREPGGTRGLDDYFARDFSHGIGAEIMGRNKFGPQRGPWSDHAWQGWWGDEPPFRTPVAGDSLSADALWVPATCWHPGSSPRGWQRARPTSSRRR